MRQLNYSHLHYFYVVAREGSVRKAAEILHITPQTISGQIAILEQSIGAELFDRHSKRLHLNARGKEVFQYAEAIFDIGRELERALYVDDSLNRPSICVGFVDVIPKVFAFEFLQHVFSHSPKARLVCREGDMDNMLAELVLNKIDIIISDRPGVPGTHIRAYSQVLGESGLSFYAADGIEIDAELPFPQCLDKLPFIMCGDKSTQKNNLLTWFDSLGLKPDIVAEFDDSALLKYFGQAGVGIFCTPTITEQHVREKYGVRVIGRTEDIKEQFYAITTKHRLKDDDIGYLIEQGQRLFDEFTIDE